MVAEAGKADKREGKPVMNQLLHEDAEKIATVEDAVEQIKAATSN